MAESKPQSACQPVMQQEDDALVRGLRDGTPEAYAALYRQFAPVIFRFAVVRLGGNEQTAEDILVQTFTDAALHIGRFNPRKAPLSTWLYGIARRHIQNEIRKQRRLKSVPVSQQVPLESAAEIPASHDVAASVSARLDAQRQFIALASVLSDVELEALILQEAEQLSLQEIAAIINRSERAVQSLLHRARQKARSLVSERK